MRRNPFHMFHRAAEAGGFPALLLVSLLSLSIMVAAIVLLAITQAAWTLAFSMLALAVAIAILSAGVEAAFSDAADPPAGQAGAPAPSPDHTPAVPLHRPHRARRRSERTA